jgi:hypothetical protein
VSVLTIDTEAVVLARTVTARPSLIAGLLPDTTSQFIHMDRNYWRKPKNIVSTYSAVGTNVYCRTNTISYTTDAIDPLEIRIRVSPHF